MNPITITTRNLGIQISATKEDENLLRRIYDPQDLEDGLLAVQVETTLTQVLQEMKAKQTAAILRQLKAP